MRRALVTLSLLGALAGCGGEDKLSAGEYRTELRKICQDSDRQTERIAEPTRATPEAIADYLGRLRDVNARTITRVEELKPPDDLRPAHDRALAANRAGRKKVDAVIEELEGGGDPTKVLSEARKELQATSEQAQAAAKELGVPECGS
jgi:regulator of protease activity HflC (stomatin/prohibitin superfamily)